MEAMKSFGVIVFVNTRQGKDESGKLPSNVEAKFRAFKERTIPKVYMTSADLTQDFGSFTYTQLKPQDFRKIFRDAKKKIRTAKKSGLLSSTGAEEKAADSETDADVVNIEDPQLETWETAKGDKVKAKLIRVDKGETYVFKTDKGKTIEAKLKHLSAESQTRLKKLVEENK